MEISIVYVIYSNNYVATVIEKGLLLALLLVCYIDLLSTGSIDDLSTNAKCSTKVRRNGAF